MAMSMACALAAAILCSILGHCEMSVYPGLRRRPIQQPVAIDPQYEQEYAFLAQMMEQHARRRLQQQFDQQLHEINMKMDRQRQLLERERYRQRQQELQVEREAEEDEYGNNLENQQYDQYDNVEAEGYYGSPMDGMPAQAPMPPMPPMQSIYLPTTHSERLDDNIRRNKAQKERIPFAVGPNDARFFDNPNDPSGELDSRALDDYEEYAPLEPTVASATPRSKVATPVSAPVPVEPPKLLDASNANFHRINPQTAAAAAVAGASASNSHEINALIDKLQKQSKSSHHPQLTMANGVAGGEAAEQIVLRQHLGMNSEMGVYIVALIAGVSAAVTVGLLALGVTWFHNRSKAAADVDYPAYGVTGPNKDVSPSGDRKLAQSAQMYHYQHQKQQIIAMENCQATDGSCGLSDVESDDDNEEGDYTVYECPGLAPTGEMEVKNPLFLDETPATPANNLATNSSSNGPSNGTSGTNNNITQATPQQPATVKKGSIKPNMNLLNAAASAVAKEEQKKRKSKK
ncbi:uncharacterized protein Dwil_GK21678 [Drosophila willistoni]|uniref:GK21678 n=1 Tax=Drosophila willistoni TaxID=7260 RepID=B4MPB3_DROWI|nr:uncharacterized protein LOC6640048 [Drosophila willistoni]EDW73952.1 uncharacterized protein Dwil_GK21678 [Drosophila willistoni]